MTTNSTTQGWLHIKPEYVLPVDPKVASPNGEDGESSKKRKRGQNQNRKRPKVAGEIKLCPSYSKGIPCPFGENCKFLHSLKEYLETKGENIGDKCPVFEALGKCRDGWRCRWLGGHVRKAEEGEEGGLDGWVLIVDEEKFRRSVFEELNRITPEELKALRSDKFPLPLSTNYLKSLEEEDKASVNGGTKDVFSAEVTNPTTQNESAKEETEATIKKEASAIFNETPLRPTEKRKINWSGLQVLAPLTTLGNPPFRRLTRSFGAQLTYSEMALSASLLKAQPQEWALPRAHPFETHRHAGPPDSYYGIQIAGGKAPSVVKTAELLTKLCGDGIDTIDLNCGCPLDMVFKSGAGSALMDNQGRLVKMLRGMVEVTGDIPITCKIRTGVSNGKNTAGKLVRRLIAENVRLSAVTLHGRSRAQRYSKAADWEYIAECSAIIKQAKKELAMSTDFSADNLEFGETQRTAFLGNGDVYSYTDYYNAIEKSGVDTTMIARGAIIKPWIFEEIQQRQHIDKSATERLDMLKQFAHWGLEHWGSDAIGVSNTRRFFCEFMSFFHRYVPLGILDHQSIPPHLHDRPPRWCGRSELETLLGSPDARDWVKVSEMFLGKTPEEWQFTPKHKSNSTDAEG